jgi:hypothetical protein
MNNTGCMVLSQEGLWLILLIVVNEKVCEKGRQDLVNVLGKRGVREKKKIKENPSPTQKTEN